MDPEFRDRNGWHAVTGMALVREVVGILLEHEALAGVPADARLEQLLSHYPYLASELQQRLSTGSLELPPIESAVVDPLPAEDHPTHA